MRTIAILVSLLLAAPLRAQPTTEHIFRPGALSVTVLGGGAAFSAFHFAESALPDAGAHERRIAPHTSPVMGAEAMVWLTPSWGLRVHGSWTPTRFDVQQVSHADGFAPTVHDSTDWRGLNVWIADVSALVRPPFAFGRFAPWLILGGGIVSYRTRGDGMMPEEAASAFSSGPRTSVAGVIGLGAAVPLQREDFALTFALTNHMTRTPLEAEPMRVRMTSNVRLLVGLTVPLGRQP